jgi:hypothetical protein
MELIGARELPGVPARMSLLLVKQEIVGTKQTAMECVLKSDVKREALSRTIKALEIDQVECVLALIKRSKRAFPQHLDLSLLQAGAELAKDGERADRAATALVGLYERAERIDEVKGAPEPMARKVRRA